LAMVLKRASGFILAAVLIALQIAVLRMLGQPFICACGYVKLWEGDIWSAGMSQHLLDWYSFTHILHGFLFYAALWLLFPRLPVSARLLLALGVEVAWEIAENSPWIIHRYREQALAVGYSGDSILNSLSDTSMMLLGFLLAWHLPVAAIVTLTLLTESFLAIAIHDNLTLNIVNLIHPFDFIRDWQNATH
jgi:hypothetical protein